MPWIRGLIFTLLVPCVVGLYVPHIIRNGRPFPGGLWHVGWLPFLLGSAIYTVCLFRFLLSGGTPAVFFTRGLKFLIGEEPPRLVQEGLYRYSRNPMYVGVLLVIFGQAVLFASSAIARYGLVAWLTFHLVVVLLEEPHLRSERGADYDLYCSQVPRWLGLRYSQTRLGTPRSRS